MAKAVKRAARGRARKAKRAKRPAGIVDVTGLASEVALIDAIDFGKIILEDDSGLPHRIQSGDHAYARDPARLLILLRRKISANAKKNLLNHFSLVEDDGKNGNQVVVLLKSVFHIWAKTADGRVVDEALLDAIGRRNEVDAATALYGRLDIPGLRGLMAPRPGLLLARRDIATRFRPQLEKAGLRIDQKRSRLLGDLVCFSGNAPVLKIGTGLGANSPDLARAIAYDLIPYASPFAVTPTDPTDTLYDTTPIGDNEVVNKQWNMKRVGARWAWGAFTGQPGDAAVTVCLFDRGVDLGHSDLNPVSQTEIAGDSTDSASTAPATAHGTQLAGIVHAQHNNGGTSMAGLAPGCPFRSLRYQEGVTPFSISTLALRMAINYVATLAGRNILLIGMEAGASLLTDSTVQTALTANTTSLIVVATGNDDGSSAAIGYFAGGGTLTPRMIIAGGYEQTSNTDRNGRVLRYEGGALVGSKVGPEVCVSAPAAGIITTDWDGTTSNKYTAVAGVRGTSLAAAHVAGIAALAWSKLGAVGADVVRTHLEQTCAKSGTDRPFVTTAEASRYRHESGATPPLINRPNGLWNEELGYGSIDASAVLVTTAVQLDAATTDMERARVIIRDNALDDVGAEPSTGSLVTECDIVVTTNAALLTPGAAAAASAADMAFDAQVTVAGASGLQEVSPAADYYVFVRVLNLGPAPARGIRVTACLAACATSFMYPSSWDNPTGAINVMCQNDLPPNDLSYLAGPLPVGNIFIARLRVPGGAAFGGFGGHACCVARVTCANDVNFNRATISGGMAQQLFNNLAQRNLSIV